MHINKHTHTHIIYRGGVKETLTAMGSCACMRRLDGGRDGFGGGWRVTSYKEAAWVMPWRLPTAHRRGDLSQERGADGHWVVQPGLLGSTKGEMGGTIVMETGVWWS